MIKKSLFILTVFLLSCSSEESKKIPVKAPDDLIPYEQIIPLIIDLQLLESHYQRLYQRPNLYKNALDSASTFVFEDYDVNSDQFRRSYQYYACDVQTLFLIYETALDSVNARVTLRQQQDDQP